MFSFSGIPFFAVFSLLDLHQESLRRPWLDIKLYKLPRLRGWAWDPLPFLQLLAYSALLALAFEQALIKTVFNRHCWLRYLVSWCLFMAVLLAVSRQHWEQWRRWHPHLYQWREVPNFGTVATLYNRGQLEQAVHHIRPVASDPATSPSHVSLLPVVVWYWSKCLLYCRGSPGNG